MDECWRRFWWVLLTQPARSVQPSPVQCSAHQPRGRRLAWAGTKKEMEAIQGCQTGNKGGLQGPIRPWQGLKWGSFSGTGQPPPITICRLHIPPPEDMPLAQRPGQILRIFFAPTQILPGGSRFVSTCFQVCAERCLLRGIMEAEGKNNPSKGGPAYR